MHSQIHSKKYLWQYFFITIQNSDTSVDPQATMSGADQISDSVLIKSIQSYLNDDQVTVKILTKDIKLATATGDNYLSLVYQVGVTYT